MSTITKVCVLIAIVTLGTIALRALLVLPHRSHPKAQTTVETSTTVQEAIEGPTVHVGGPGFHAPDFTVHTWYFRDDNQGLCFAVSDPPGPGYVFIPRVL